MSIVSWLYDDIRTQTLEASTSLLIGVSGVTDTNDFLAIAGPVNTLVKFGIGQNSATEWRIGLRPNDTSLKFDNTTTDLSSPRVVFLSTGNVQFAGVLEVYGGIATVSKGVPTEYAKADLTAQVAAQSAVQFYAVPASGAGMYRITWSAKVTTPATTSCVLGGATGFQVGYTDADDSVVVTTPAWWGGGNNGAAPTSASTNTTQNQMSGEIIVSAKASTNITFSFGYTSVGGTAMQYSLHVKLEAL